MSWPAPSPVRIAPGTGLRAAAFLDRDGTLIVERDYLSDPDGVELLPGVVGALRALRDAGFLLVVVTNQSGIGRGFYSEGDYARVRARLDELLESEGVRLDATFHCPDAPDAPGAAPPPGGADPRATSGGTPCRKPAPGMHLRAAAELGIDLALSVYIGDRVSDLLPAVVLGGRGILVRTGYGRQEESSVPAGAAVAEDLAEAVEHLLRSA